MPNATHEGWFWFCPILASFNSDGEIMVEARWPWLEWLFTVSEYLEGARISMSVAMWPDYEPSFMFKLREIKAKVAA